MSNPEPYLQMQAVEAWLAGRPVFRDLSLELYLGQHAVVLGPNGSGKSSLIRLLVRELYPVVKPGSSLRLFGQENIHLGALRQRIGVLSSDLQARHAAAISAEEVVASGWFGSVGLGRHHQLSAAQWQQVSDWMGELGLDGLRRRRFGTLSDGEKRRLLLARALVHKPQVLVLDEPTNGLDLGSRQQLLAILRQLARSGTTLLLVTHQLEAIIPEIQRVVLLRSGQLIGDGPADAWLQAAPLSALFETPLQVVEQGGWRQLLPC